MATFKDLDIFDFRSDNPNSLGAISPIHSCYTIYPIDHASYECRVLDSEGKPGDPVEIVCINVDTLDKSATYLVELPGHGRCRFVQEDIVLRSTLFEDTDE